MRVLFASILVALPAWAKATPSFRGMLGNAPIWMDLEVPTGDGEVKGSYMYLKYGKSIPLEGAKKDSALRLEERSGGKVTGLFKIVLAPLQDNSGLVPFSAFEKMSLSGSWNKPGKRKELSVWAYQVDPAYRSCALISPDSLRLESGKTFGEELDEHNEEANSNPGLEEKSTARYYEISGCAGGFLSTYNTWSYANDYRPTYFVSGSSRRVFDVAGKREIRISDEIDENEKKRFSAFMAKQLDDLLAELRKGPEPGQYQVNEGSEFDFYLDHENPMVGFSLDITPEEGQGSGYETVEKFVSVPYRELKKYLKKDSVLRRLGGRPR